uniref:Protein kinase domain-containing protein n=1 Tax=Oryza meridionalis TaxID=40149 RepID=A0A0E0CBH3_9ORYZ
MDTGMRVALHRQVSSGSLKESGELRRQSSLESPRTGRATTRFLFGRQSSMDPNRRRGRSQSPVGLAEDLTVPDNLDATMQLLFLACHGDAAGVEALLRGGVDVNSINLDGRTALHIASCEGHPDVVRAVADAKCYGHTEVYNLLKARGAKIPRNRRTPMMVSNPGDIPEYELNPSELQFKKGDEVVKGVYQVAKWNGTKVHVKILDRECYCDQEVINSFRHELTVLEKVRHPNVVQFVGAVTQNIPMMIISEYLPNGDLSSCIPRKGKLHGQKVLKYGLEIARGMTYLHQCKPDPIIHCDLKPKNEIFDASVDAFSFGFILYEMVEGTHTVHGKSSEESGHTIRYDGMRPSLKNKLRGYPPDFKALIEECWDTQGIARPTFSEIIIRLDKIYAQCMKQGTWKDSLKIWK